MQARIATLSERAMSSAAMAQTVIIGATSRLCWVTHLPVGWVFTPARGRGTCLTAASTPTFVGAFPRWTGGLAGTWSDEVAKDQNNCANVDSAKVARFCSRMR